MKPVEKAALGMKKLALSQVLMPLPRHAIGPAELIRFTDVPLNVLARYRIFGYCESAESPEEGVEVNYESCGTCKRTGSFEAAAGAHTCFSFR